MPHFFFVIVILTAEVFAFEPLYLQVIVNGEKKGDFLFYVHGKDYYLKKIDLADMGVKELLGETKEIEGEIYILLNSAKGVEKIEVDEQTATMTLTINPKFLERHVIDFYPHKRTRGYYPEKEKSLFLNYRLDYAGGDNSNFRSFSLNNELGINYNNLLFLNETFYERKDNSENFIRLNSAIYKDDRKNLTRLIIGDFFTPPDALSGGMGIGGISYSKNYKLDPYQVYRPTMNILGTAKSKSIMEVYLDGVPIRREIIQPGEFELKNLYSYQGQRDVVVVIKDSYNNIQKEVYPFYFADNVLKKGLSEFSYNVGFKRENYGAKSNDYGSPIFNFYHRYGYRDDLNLGLSSEFEEKSFYIAPEFSYFRPNFGVLSLKTYLNKNDLSNNINLAFLTNYTFQRRYINYGLYFTYFTKDFKTSGYNNLETQKSYEVQGNVGVFSPQYGSFNFGLIHRDFYDNTKEEEALFSYSKTLFKNFSLYVNTKNKFSGKRDFEIFLGFSYHMEKDRSLFYRHQSAGSFDTDALQINKNAPIGEGIGYRVSAENSKGEGRTINTLSPYIEYKTPYNVYTADINLQEEAGKVIEHYNLSVAGAVVLIAGKVGFTRPIYDSFALVKFDDLEGMPILFNNQKVAKTDKNGIAFLSDLNSYTDNIITFPIKKIPLNYSVMNEKINISPPYRYGSCISIPVKRIYRYEGYLKVSTGERAEPLSYTKVAFKALHKKDVKREDDLCKKPFGEFKDESEGDFITASDGNFYLENVLPGSYTFTFNWNGQVLSYDINLPDSDDVLIDLGEIVIPVTSIK